MEWFVMRLVPQTLVRFISFLRQKKKEKILTCVVVCRGWTVVVCIFRKREVSKRLIFASQLFHDDISIIQSRKQKHNHRTSFLFFFLED
jgi:hypothetical protein